MGHRPKTTEHSSAPTKPGAPPTARQDAPAQHKAPAFVPTEITAAAGSSPAAATIPQLPVGTMDAR